MLKHFSKQHGQALVFYALFMPLILLFVGVGLDLGWYYLNVSRLQNAADAAALAGAQALIKKDNAFENYYIVALADNKLPKDFDDYENVYKNTFDSATIANGELINYKTESEVKGTLLDGRALAEEYARKNLSDANEVNISETDQSKLSATDGWAQKQAAKKVSGTIALKYKIVDGKNDVYGPLYYEVSLEEKIRHFFLSGWFDDMSAPVKAVVLLQPHNKGLITPMEYFERTKVIDNWEYTNNYKDSNGLSVSGGKWNHYQAGIRSNNNYGVRYTSGNPNRTESVIVTPNRKTSGKNVISSADGSSGEATDANGGKWYSSTDVDSINIDLRAEVKGKFSSDWDIGYDFPETGHSYQFSEGWSATDGADKRILFNAEFDAPFETRDPSKAADILWTRIESDPLKNPYDGAGVNNFNSVVQITLNFNTDNTAVYESGENEGNYKYRPYFIFYDGPENIDYKTDSNGVLIRHSQPVVINLNEDLNAIIYMPESPVIINGNNHAWHGFVIAKCFLQTVTEDDMTRGNSFVHWDGFNAPKTYVGNYSVGKDGLQNTVYFKPDELIYRTKIDEKYPAATITEESAGNLTVREKLKAPQYILLEYTKDDHNTYLVTEDGKVNENKTFAAYVNATYKEKFKTFHGLSDDSQITAVTFPNEDYNETTAIYYVITADLEDSPADGYVKVMVGDSPKYVAKSKLPYVKVRTNQEYFYVCVSDLRLPASSSNVKGVRMIDNSYTDEQLNSSYKKNGNVTSTDADIFINYTSINIYGDSWKIPTTVYNNNKNNWKKDMLEFGEQGGVKYFMIKKEIEALPKEPQVIAKYQKITFTKDGEEVTKYAKVGDKLYYTKVYNNANNSDNYLIVDENGNMLAKPVTSPGIFSVTDEASNNALPKTDSYWSQYTREPTTIPKERPEDEGQILNGKYVGKDAARLTKDYLIPPFERVYKMSTFNLSDNSFYSYFQIEELWRVNYIYLDVDEAKQTVYRKPSNAEYNWKVSDMFFTTRRASWID